MLIIALALFDCWRVMTMVCSQICENPIRDDNIHHVGFIPPSPCGFYGHHPQVMVGLWLGFTLMIMHPRPRRPFDHHAVFFKCGKAGGCRRAIGEKDMTIRNSDDFRCSDLPIKGPSAMCYGCFWLCFFRWPRTPAGFRYAEMALDFHLIWYPQTNPCVKWV